MYTFAEDEQPTTGGIPPPSRQTSSMTTPASSLITPTKINITKARGGDEVHPLAAVAASASSKKQHTTASTTTSSSSSSATNNYTIETTTQIINTSLENSDLSSNISQRNNSEASSSGGQQPQPATPNPNIISSKQQQQQQTNNPSKLNNSQQIAMDNFLAAQKSGNLLAKEEMWKELVRSMKQPQDPPQYTTSRSTSRRALRARCGGGSSKKSGNNSRGSNKSWSSSKDDILGLIRIGGGNDAVSIASGLTSADASSYFGATVGSKKSRNTDTYSKQSEMWAREVSGWMPSPTSSPIKQDGGSGAMAMPQLKQQQQKQIFRSVTPPSVVLPKTASAKFTTGQPMISPLSVDDGNWADDTLVSSASENDDDDSHDSEDSNKEKEQDGVFFDIGESFANNTRHLWSNGDNNPPSSQQKAAAAAAASSASLFPKNAGAIMVGDPTLSLADLSDGEEGKDSSLRNNVPHQTGGMGQRLLPIRLPSPRRSPSLLPQNGTYPATTTAALFDSNQNIGFATNWDTTTLRNTNTNSNSLGFIAQTIDGEVVTFQDNNLEHCVMDDAFVTRTQWPNVQQQRAGPLKQHNRSASLDMSRSSSRHRKSKSNNNNALQISLEDQILSVLQQQPESHIVEDDVGDHDDNHGDEDDNAESEKLEQQEEFFGRSSPIVSPQQTAKNATGKKKSGTVGSTASAQDILRELRSSTPTTLQSSGNNSSLNSSGRNKPPLSISFGVGGKSSGRTRDQQQQQQQTTTTTRKQQQYSGSRVAVAQEKNIANVPHLSTKGVVPSCSEINIGSSGDKRSPTRQPKTRALLAPSRRDVAPRRDVPRPNRINRRAFSEPTAPSSAVTAGSTRPKAEPTATTSSAANNLMQKPSQTNDYSCIQNYASPFDDPIPLTRSNNHRLRKLFPNTSPAAVTKLAHPTSALDMVPPPPVAPTQQLRSTNPFDSPPRISERTNEEDPFVSKTSPIPMECSIEDLSSSCNEVDVPSVEHYGFEESAVTNNITTSATTSLSSGVSSDRAITETLKNEVETPGRTSSSKASSEREGIRVPPPPTTLLLAQSKRDSVRSRNHPVPSHSSLQQHTSHLDQIRASISQLKHNGVGGIEHGTPKSRSTLARNEATGRYVIRVEDDILFDKRVKMIDDEGEAEKKGNIMFNELILYDHLPSRQELTTSENIIASTSSTMKEENGSNPLRFMMGETVLDDTVVDDAVRVATECLSESSTSIESETARFEQEEEQQRVENMSASDADNEFFVIRRPSNKSAWGYDSGWSAFGTSNKISWNAGSDGEEDSFAGQWDCDDNSSGEDNSCWEEVEKVNDMIPPGASPTSVFFTKREVSAPCRER